MRRAGGQRGFTLLELLITLSVTTIGLIGLLSLHLSVTRGNDGASRSAEAQQIGAGVLESLRAMTTQAINNQLGPPPVTPAPFTVAGRGGMTFTVARSITVLNGASGNLWKIRVVTSWTEDGAATGANGGQLDHSLALEVIRTYQEDL